MKWEGSTGPILWNYGQRAARSIQKWLRANFSTVQLDQARLASSLTQCIWYLHQTCFFFLIASICKNRYTSHDHIRWFVWQNLDHVRTNWNPQIYLRVNVNLGLKVNIGFNFLCRRVHIRVRLLLGFISLWQNNYGEKSKQKIILQCYKTKFKIYTNTLLWTAQPKTTLPYINITYLTKANSLLSSKEWIRFECCLISSWGVEILNQTLLYNYLWTAPTIFSMT